MDFETGHSRLMRYPEAEATTPFGPDVLVCKVAGKMFALVDPARSPRLNAPTP